MTPRFVLSSSKHSPRFKRPMTNSRHAVSGLAVMLGWGEPARSEEFDGPLGPDWRLYDGPGHVDNGRRSPAAIETSGGLLTITGDAKGTTGGMAWIPGQKYGRWVITTGTRQLNAIEARRADRYFCCRPSGPQKLFRTSNRGLSTPALVLPVLRT